MHIDLERLIGLQQIELAADQARRTIDGLPARLQQLDDRLALAQAALDAAKASLADCNTRRREVEKDLAVVQSRLSKYKDQLMEVKTNKEYQAMQKEIATAETEVRAQEDRILDRMEEAERIGADLRQAEATLATERKETAAERTAIETERGTLDTELTRLAGERARVVATIGPEAIALYDRVFRIHRGGVSVVEARNGHCSFCHVRLRPQVFNEIRRNASLIQCESCHRILYFVAPAAADVKA